MSARAWDEMIAIGVVLKPQGRRGEVAVKPLSDRPGRFPGLRRAFVPGPGGGVRALTVEDCWPHKGGFVLKLKGLDSIEAAEGLRGLELRIGADELDVLPEGSYYHHQLVGLRALDAGGRELGRVERVWETGAEAPVLVLQGSGGELLVPLADAFVGAIDLGAGTLRVTLHDAVTVDAAR